MHDDLIKDIDIVKLAVTQNYEALWFADNVESSKYIQLSNNSYAN